LWWRGWRSIEEMERELRRMQRELNRMLEALPRVPPMLGGRVAPALGSPWADVYETDGEVVVEVDLPGMEKENIHVNATEETLEVSAEAKRAEEVKEAGYGRRERGHRRFSRRFSLPAKVNPEGAKSTYRNGVLTVRLPKKEVERRKGFRVPIE